MIYQFDITTIDNSCRIKPTIIGISVRVYIGLNRDRITVADLEIDTTGDTEVGFGLTIGGAAVHFKLLEQPGDLP